MARTNVAPDAAEPSRESGGYRGTTAAPRFTAQIGGMVRPDTRNAIVALAEEFQVSQGCALRAILESGLPIVRQRIAKGQLDLTALA